MTLISIIIPTFNRTDLIFNCLTSIIRQTHVNWECIIVDDHSGRECYNLLNDFCKKDDRIKLYKRPDNLKKGANTCRNYGLEISTGNHIIFFDSDDLMKPEKLEKQIQLINANNNDYVICQSEVLDSINNKKRLWNDNLLSDYPIDDYIQYKISWAICSILFKKSFLIINNLKFDNSLAQSQEYDFFVRVLYVSKNYSVDLTSLNIIFWHQNSISFSDENFFNKSKSSLLVRKRFLLNKNLNLKSETKFFLVNDIIRILSKSIELLNVKAIEESYRVFVSSIIILPINRTNKFKNIIYATLTYLSYKFLGRGYYFYKKIKF
jgi:glycosyltransferase involved in cell wall biosynthesis